MYENEIKIIKLSSKPMVNQEILYKINDLCKKEINWGYIFYIMLHHRVTAIVYDNLEKSGSLKYIEKHVRRAMKTECIRILEKNTLFLQEINKINTILEQKAIFFVNIKGASFLQRLYPYINYREFTDIDYLIKKEDISVVTKCLNDVGYIQGEYDFITNNIRPYSRKEIIEKIINSHECAEFVRLSNSQFFSSFIVDINYSIIWQEYYNKRDEKNKVVLSNQRDVFSINGINYFHLSNEDELIQLCCHLYSEAMFFLFDPFWKREQSDISIIKLCDILLLIKKYPINWCGVRKKAILQEVVEPVCYSLDCVERFYDDLELPFNVHQFFDCELPKETLIDKYYDKNFNVRFWECSYEDRLFDMKKKLVEINSL